MSLECVQDLFTIKIIILLANMSVDVYSNCAYMAAGVMQG